MIRFCDKEVCCVIDEELDRQQLLTYFMNGHRNEPVCVLKESGAFLGMITYDSLLGKDMQDSVKTDFVVLDERIWENGRKYFGSHSKKFGGAAVLPVLNKEYQLICFAWNDRGANRELRMLNELMECENALSFRDVYSEYDCVTIHGCNELSYYFAQYLRKIGISVNVMGTMWESFGIWEETETLDYRNFIVHGEGVGTQEEKLEQRKSVSAEFECIDRIYEENICKGIIGDTQGSFQEVLDRICGKQIAIIGTGYESQNAYDLLLGYGIDICCFISEKTEEQAKLLFGKKILSRADAAEHFREVIFIDSETRYSAWGFGDTDLYCYLGCRRNRTFFCLRDYIEIPRNGLRNVLRYVQEQTKGRIVLLGDMWMCLKVNQILEYSQGMYGKIVYADILQEYEENSFMTQISGDEIEKEDICLLAIPEYYIRYLDYTKIRREKYGKKLKELNITNIVNYSQDNLVFLDSEGCRNGNKKSELSIGKIVIGAINYSSGNILFRELLDNHADVLMLDYGYLNNNLFSICTRLSTEKSTDILKVFWRLCDAAAGIMNENMEVSFPKREIFDQSMERMLNAKDWFTSQELFVMIHIACAKMWGKEIHDVSKMVIYWEPHFVPREKCEDYAVWLGKEGTFGYIINIVRNAYVRAGSNLKVLELSDKLYYRREVAFQGVLIYPNSDKKEYEDWKRLVIRFEDLKCNPKKELLAICDELGIAWSDTLLETTRHGVQSSYRGVSGFDLKPVYNTYEEYFSEFDRFRISLITGPWQKQYGYPYVSSLDFSKCELRELFLKKFRFEEKLVFYSAEENLEFRNWLWELISGCLQMTRREEILERSNAGKF